MRAPAEEPFEAPANDRSTDHSDESSPLSEKELAIANGEKPYEGEIHDIDPFDGPLDPEVEEFIGFLAQGIAKRPEAIGEIGGNILIHFINSKTFTLVTRGPNPGLFARVTDDPIDFLLVCEQFVLVEMLQPEGAEQLKREAARWVQDEYLHIEGDFRVFERLLNFLMPSHKGGLAAQLAGLFH